THEFNMLFPLMVAVFVSYGFTAVTMKRSILTEKVSRRGFHLSREYAIDPLEIMLVRDVMRTDIIVLSPADAAAPEAVRQRVEGLQQRLFPVADESGTYVGVVRAKDVPEFLVQARDGGEMPSCVNRNPVVALPDEPLRAVVNRMAEHSVTRLPVVALGTRPELLGIIALHDLLQARVRNLKDERLRERT